MSIQEVLLLAICEAPDDDTPRLIYADWLEERGDPRAEFIRGQCTQDQRDMAQTDPRYWSLRFDGRTLGVNGPHYVDGTYLGVPWDDLICIRMIEDLHNYHAFEWLREINPHLGNFARSTIGQLAFHRGFVDTLYVRQEGGLERVIPQADAIFAPPLLHCVHVTVDADVLEPLVRLPYFNRISSLTIRGPQWNNYVNDPIHLERAVRALTDSPFASGLTFLGIEQCVIKASEVERLLDAPQLQRLQTLKLEGADWTDGVGVLYYPSIDREGLQLLASSPCAARLTSLGLAKNNMTVAEAEIVADSLHLQNLTCLDLSWNYIDERDKEALRARLGHRLYISY